MTPQNPDELMQAVLPPAFEVMTAWSIAGDGDRAVFHQAMQRVIADAMDSDEPLRAVAQLMFGVSSLSGILLDELATSTDRTRNEVLQALHASYLDPSTR